MRHIAEVLVGRLVYGMFPLFTNNLIKKD